MGGSYGFVFYAEFENASEIFNQTPILCESEINFYQIYRHNSIKV